MAKKLILALLAVAAALTVFWAYYGGFATPAPVNRVNTGPFNIAYISHTGPYKKIGKVMQQLDNDLEAQGITIYRKGGLFYDDPAISGEVRARSEAIAILTPDQIEKIKGNPKFKTKIIERRHYLHTAFPYRGSLSILAGVMKVYPLYKKYFTDNKLKPYVYREKGYEGDYGIEIYGPDKIFYYMTFTQGDS